MTQWSHANKLIDTIFPKRERSSPSQRKTTMRTGTSKARRINLTQEQAVPVMVRGNVYGLPLQETKRSKSRQRVNVALNVPGVQISLPAIPQIHFGWRLVSLIFGTILLGLLYFAWTAPFLKVTSPEITGLQRLTEQDVNVVLQLTGKQIFMVYPNQLEKALTEAFPEFTKVDVQVDIPNSVKIQVEERTPILIWKQEDKSVLVDANGFAFPMRESAASEPTLIVQASGPPPASIETQTNLEPIRFLPVEMVSALVSLSAIVPTDTNLVYDSAHGLGWKDKKGWEVYFGDVSDIDMKLNVYKALIQKLKKEKIEPALISVEYVNAPYYRLER
jgi:cell division protein FtsQ